MENILISACLLGVACRYDGEKKEYNLENLKQICNLIPFCPEIYGGLPIPRVPSEIVGDRVINLNGIDVTPEYEKGAREAVRLAKLFDVKYALLKAKSPSCGNGEVYDGTFSRTVVKGDGVTAALLKENNVEIFTENELGKLLKFIQ